MNPAKRRRLDANASTLRKPFRSPLKVPTDDRASQRPSTPSNPEQQKPLLPPSVTSKAVYDSRKKKSHLLPSPGTPLSATALSSTDEITVLQKRYSALTQELRRLSQDLDVTGQAQKLSLSNQGKELDRLILKWRDIARSAADQVFDISNGRIKEMGGIHAWQKSTQESSQCWLEYEQSLAGDSDRRKNVDAIDKQITETTEAVNVKGHLQNGEQHEQTFTMITMLHQMNIDPDLLGYDELNEQWTD